MLFNELSSDSAGQNVEELLNQLINGSWLEFGPAFTALSEAGGQAVPALIDLLQHWQGDEIVCQQVSEILTIISEPAVPSLINLILYGDDKSCFWAAVTLGTMAHNCPQWDGHPIADQNAFEPLVTIFQSRGPKLRRAAISALAANYPERAFDLLISAAADEDEGIRFNATYFLGESKDARAIKTLATALDDPNQKVRDAAVEALGNFGIVRVTT